MEQKKNEKLFKEIKKEKKSIEKNLQIFLETIPGEEKKNYIAFQEVFEALQSLDLENMEYTGPVIDGAEDKPLKLKSKLSISAGISILCTIIYLKIYDENSMYKGIPDVLMNDITMFHDKLQEFIISLS